MMLFLDLDGTLTDPKPGITGAIRHALGELGLPVPDADDLTWAIGPSLLDSFARLGAPDPEQALDIYRQHYTTGGLFDCRVYDGIPKALADLRGAGHDMALATAKPHAYATKITAHFGLNEYLAHQFGPELDGTRNDKGDLLAYAMNLCGLAAEQAIMIGDRSHDIQAARDNGMRVIGVRWGYGDEAELAQADVICESPRDLSSTVTALLADKR